MLNEAKEDMLKYQQKPKRKKEEKPIPISDLRFKKMFLHFLYISRYWYFSLSHGRELR